ncbi:hypothetical protein T265_04870 [Opisthorchis viverrini]|uniref:Uncharacterized protein n=1 Tax=Opisthorchis viverrini TaxID=6198 RepID=A0A074ZY91_OPIVI|nr:hypothetical protein T265_04870 [Opisthorchis viverrini]KER28270.1 hypothetical protein T265_04870 [Opisthorchis viverrini]
MKPEGQTPNPTVVLLSIKAMNNDPVAFGPRKIGSFLTENEHSENKMYVPSGYTVHIYPDVRKSEVPSEESTCHNGQGIISEG